MKRKTTSRCPGCGGILSLCPRGGRVQEETVAFCAHVSLVKTCAEEMYEAGHAVAVQGKVLIAESIHPRKLECGKYVVRASDYRGTLTTLGDYSSMAEARRDATDWARLPRINPQVSSWRGGNEESHRTDALAYSVRRGS